MLFPMNIQYLIGFSLKVKTGILKVIICYLCSETYAVGFLIKILILIKIYYKRSFNRIEPLGNGLQRIK